MDFDFPINLSWREALIALVALLVLYVVVAFLRIRRLKRLKAAEAPLPTSSQAAVAAYAAAVEPEIRPESASAKPEPVPLAEPSEAAFPWNEPPDAPPLQQQISVLESEIAQLRREVGSLRAEVLVLREEQQREMEAVEVTQNVSPLYNDAMQIALQGHDAATISQHCGISRAEAELVVALVRNRDEG